MINKALTPTLAVTFALCFAPVTNAQTQNLHNAQTLTKQGQKFHTSPTPAQAPQNQTNLQNTTLHRPTTIAAGPNNTYLIADSGNHRILKINTKTNTVTKIAGAPQNTWKTGCEKNTNPQRVCLPAVHGVDINQKGQILITNTFKNTILQLNTNGKLTTIAGTGQMCNRQTSTCGENTKATNATLKWPTIARYTKTGILISDSSDRILKVDTSGTLRRVAGTGTPGFSGDHGKATNAKMWGPADAIEYKNGILISDGNNCRLRWVNPQGTIKPFAGYGTDLAWCHQAYGDTFQTKQPWANSQGQNVGDGGNAKTAKLSVTGFLTNVNNDIYVTDFLNNRVRKISNGKITTILGTGQNVGTNGDSNLSTKFQIAWPSGIAYDKQNKKLLVTEGGANRLIAVNNIQ